jgi:hypothetical protein
MLDLLKRGRDEYGVVSVKAEFEAEGTRPDEFLRLLHLAHCADLKVTLKIGGCEAVSDLLSSKLYGVHYIVAPMVETPYALSKFIEAKNKTHGKNEEGVEFLFNLETQTTLEHLGSMIAAAQGKVNGVVFGRVDFTLSRGMARGAIDEPTITEAVLRTAQACADNNLDLVVGGSVSPAAIPALRAVRRVHLSRFETRKVIFAAEALDRETVLDGIQNAVDFELLWLVNKQEYYNQISNEDTDRIKMMRARQNTSFLLRSVNS